MRTFSFWQKWLLAAGLIITGFGLILALFNQTPLFDALFNNQINPVFWPSTTSLTSIRPFQQWAYSVLGATVAGWGVFFVFLAHYAFPRKERWVWNCLAVGTGLWYIVDTTLSLSFGVWYNALFNTILLVIVLLPLIFTRKDFPA